MEKAKRCISFGGKRLLQLQSSKRTAENHINRGTVQRLARLTVPLRLYAERQID